jgi:ribokinase
VAGHIVGVGSLNMDLVVRAPRHPIPGETILGSDFRTFPGGKGANQAVAAARSGGIVSMIGRVGEDDFGTALLHNLAGNGVNAKHVQRDAGDATGVALITVSESGQNTIVVASGANWRVSPADIVAAAGEFEHAGVLLLQLETPVPAVTRAAEEAHRRGVRVVLNPAPARSLEESLLRLVDVLTPNQSELALLTGESDPEAGAVRLKEMGVRNVIVTLGEQGVLVVDEAGASHIPRHEVQVVDTTAAGDAFVGAFAVALSGGRTLVEAARWGNAAAALSVTRAGAQPSLPTRAEVEKFLAGQ